MKKWLLMLLSVSMLLSLVSCGGGNATTPTVEQTTVGQTQAPAPERDPIELKFMSFNVWVTLPKKDGALTEPALNRIAALRSEIQMHDPDVLGLQEDSTTWLENINLEGYESYYRTDITGSNEHCAIFYKSSLNCVEKGSKWLTSTGSSGAVAITMADLNGNGEYALTDEEMARLMLTRTSDEKEFRKSRKQYINDAGETVTMDTAFNYLAARLMNYVVLEDNGKYLIYVNTHLQHRSQNSEYISDALTKLRTFERLKQFSMVQDKIEALKKTYPDASVVITGDFNDEPFSEIYEMVTGLGYRDSAFAAKRISGNTGSWNNWFDSSVHGDNYPSERTGSNSRIDFCFLSSDLKVSMHRISQGYGTITTASGEKKNIYTSDHLAVVVTFEF